MKDIFESLQEQEETLCKKPEFSRVQALRTTSDARAVARSAFLWEKPKEHVKAANNISFEGCNDRDYVAFHSEMPEIPLLGQLLYHSQVIVRIRPWSRLRFILRFGITAEQMADLAREGWVVPALYYPAKNEAYRRETHLHKLFDFEQTGAQIDYLRQQAFLPADADKFGERNRSPVRDQLAKLSRRDLNYLIDQPDSIDGAATVVVRHITYLDSFADLRDDANRFVEKLKTPNLSQAGVFDTVRDIITKSRSNVHGLSGAFGGWLEPDLRFTKFWEHPMEHSINSESEKMLAELEFHLNRSDISFRKLKKRPGPQLAPPESDEWQAILGELHRLREDQQFRRKRTETREALKRIFKDIAPQQAAKSLDEAFNFLRNTAQVAIRWERFGDLTALGVTGALAGTFFDSTTLGAVIGGVTGQLLPKSSHYVFVNRSPGETLANYMAKDGMMILERVGELGRPCK